MGAELAILGIVVLALLTTLVGVLTSHRGGDLEREDAELCVPARSDMDETLQAHEEAGTENIASPHHLHVYSHRDFAPPDH